MMKPPEISELVAWRLVQAERNVARSERRVVQAEQALAAAALAAEAALQQERERVAALQAELKNVYASTSWRISHPVRVASRVLQALRQHPPQLLLPPTKAPPLPSEAPPLAPREQAILRRLQNRGLN